MSKKTAKLIASINFKGGVGKSTLTSILASEFNNEETKAIVLNIALGQSAESINEIETIDYSDLLSTDPTTTVSEVIADIMEEYDYIFIDTPGELSDELVEIAPYVDYFITPFDKGKRVFEDTIICIESIFTSGIIDTDVFNMALVYNKYTKAESIPGVKMKYEKKLQEIENNFDIKFNTVFTQLSNSDAIETMEENKASIKTLDAKNRVAYNVFKKRVNQMTADIKNHMQSINIKG